MVDLKQILETALPIILGLGLAGLQRWYMWYKTKKFHLIDHPLFSDLAISINEIKGWYVSKNRDVFKDALIIKLNCWLEKGKELAIELEKNKYSNLQLQNKILQWAMDVLDKYTNKWKEQNIPDIVIERITNFHQLKVDRFISEIKSICFNNDMYLFKTQKIIAIFDALRLLLAETKSDFNELLYRERYNGHFKGVKYKGIPINDDEFKIYIETLKNNNNG